MFAHIMMVFGLAPALAPILGGYLQLSFGWRASFCFLTAFGVLMYGVAWGMMAGLLMSLACWRRPEAAAPELARL